MTEVYPVFCWSLFSLIRFLFQMGYLMNTTVQIYKGMMNDVLSIHISSDCQIDIVVLTHRS